MALARAGRLPAAPGSTQTMPTTWDTRVLDRFSPEFQTLEIGQWVPMAPTPTEITAFTVAGFEPNRWLLWEQPTSTWAWRLSEDPTARPNW